MRLTVVVSQHPTWSSCCNVIGYVHSLTSKTSLHSLLPVKIHYIYNSYELVNTRDEFELSKLLFISDSRNQASIRDNFRRYLSQIAAHNFCSWRFANISWDFLTIGEEEMNASKLFQNVLNAKFQLQQHRLNVCQSRWNGQIEMMGFRHFYALFNFLSQGIQFFMLACYAESFVIFYWKPIYSNYCNMVMQKLYFIL